MLVRDAAAFETINSVINFYAVFSQVGAALVAFIDHRHISLKVPIVKFDFDVRFST